MKATQSSLYTYIPAPQRLVGQNVRLDPVKRIKELKVKVELHIIKSFWLPAHAIATGVENMVQHTPHDGTGSHAHAAIRSRRINPLEKANQEAELLYNVGPRYRGVFRMAAFE